MNLQFMKRSHIRRAGTVTPGHDDTVMASRTTSSTDGRPATVIPSGSSCTAMAEQRAGNRISQLAFRIVLLLVLLSAGSVESTGNAQSIGTFSPEEVRSDYNILYIQGRAERAKHNIIFQSDGKYGLKNAKSDEIIVKPTYDKISDFINGYAEFQKEDKKGILDQFGNEYLKAKYKEIIFPPTRMFEIAISPFFIVSEKGDGKYRLVSNKSPKGEQFSQIRISPDLYCFGEIEDDVWSPISIQNCKAIGNTFHATRKELTIRQLSDNYFFFNNNIYRKYPSGLSYSIICITDKKADKKEIELSGTPFLFDGSSIIDLTSFPDFKIYRRLNDPARGQSETLDTADGMYLESSDGYYIVQLFLVTDNHLFQFELPQEYDSRNKNVMFDEIKNDWKGLLSFTETHGNENMGLFAGEKIIFPASFKKVRFGRYKKDDEIFIICRALDDTRSEPVEYYDKAYETLEEVAGNHVALYVRTPAISRLYGLSGSPMDVERWDDLFPFTKGLYKTVSNGKEGLVKFSDEGVITVLPSNYDNITQNDDLTYGWTPTGPYPNILVEKEGKIGLYADDGTEIIPCKYDKIEKLYQLIQQQKPLIMKVTANGRTGLIGIDRKVILPCEYADITSSYDDNDNSTLIYATDIKGNKTMFSANGKPLIPSGAYDSFGSGGRVYKNGRMGFIDEATKKLIIPCKYDSDALQGGIYGPHNGKNTRIALGYENDNGTATIDIWTFAGKKLASKSFPSNARYSMASFIEQWLGVEIGW